MEKYDPSQITEFPRFEEETSQGGVSTFFNKLWKLPLFSPSETEDNSQNSASATEKPVDPQPEDLDKQEDDDSKTETGAYAVEFEGRSLPNVLKRISSLVALGSKGGTRYADTELARYWMPDEISRECYECAARFRALRRRHHCRVCGQIFCARCCSQTVPGHIFGCAGGLRVCNYCCNVVLSYLKENEMSGDMSTDLRTLQENLQVKFPENKMQKASTGDNFTLARDDERCEVRSGPKEALQDVFRQLTFTLPTHSHRYRLVRYNGVWRGCDILQWIMDNTNNKTRAQATLISQNLLSAGYMQCVTELTSFADYALYKPLVSPVTQQPTSPEDCKQMVESVSSYCLDLNLGDSSARLIKASKTETNSPTPSEEETPILNQNEARPEATNVCKAIAESGEDHLKLLLRQCLVRHSLPSHWLDVLLRLCCHAANITMPDLYGNDIDIRNYVQVKKAPGGTIRDSCVIPGVVMTKNVAHRGMPQQITNPTVLLLDCSIAFQRVEGKLTSLEPLLLQEREYLVRCARRLSALRPRVVLVRGSVARAVQDALRLDGVALAAGVGEHALIRTARCARAEIVTSIDARIGTPKLGTCKNFYVKNFSGKTLMVLEGCAEPHLGCTILLRGATSQELVRVKKVVKFMLLACYNWKLEKAFLGDIEAILPEHAMNFDDEDRENKEDKNDTTDSFAQKMTDVHKSDSDKRCDEQSSSELDVENEMKDEKLDEKLHRDKKEIETPEFEIKPADIFQDMRSTTKEQYRKLDENLFEENKDKESKTEAERKDTSYKTKKSPEEENNKVTESKTKTEEKDTSDKTKDKKSPVDPLQKPTKYIRKTESDKLLSCGVPVGDFSDPLHATLSGDDDVFQPKTELRLKTDENIDQRWSTDDVLLSMSPNVVIPQPYLETEAGRRCALRNLFPPLRRLDKAPHTPRAVRKQSTVDQAKDDVKDLHPFLYTPITATDDPAFKTLLANYRAMGSRTNHNAHTPGCPLYNPSILKPVKKPVTEPEKQPQDEPLDPLAPENHQRISLLLYSYSNKSANVPDFCVNPWIATMEMYGRHDISLGGFLQKYCFNADYKCTSKNCQVPMNQHVRRFAHEDVCLTITCNTVGHSNVDKLKEEQSNQVMFWSRCEWCGTVGRGSRLSRLALSLSLAQYVLLRCRAPRLTRTHCSHPMHAHVHAFYCRLTTACFRFSKISTFDISLPPPTIYTRYDTKQMRDALITQLNDLMLRGHETFSNVTDAEADKEYNAFKVHTEPIHLALTSDQLGELTSLEAVVRTLWGVSDSIITGEKMLRDAQDKWSSPVKPGKAQVDSGAAAAVPEEKSDIEDSSECHTDSDTTSRDLEREHVTEEDEERGDKKTVRQILSQLLSNNSAASQSGMIISSGLIPVVVIGGEIGSVIAATLASVTYNRSLQRFRQSQTESEEDKDKEGDKKKSNDHIEVLLKDGLLCRVYYAPQFHRLRHMLLAPLDSNPHITDGFTNHCADGDHAKCCDDGRDNKPLCEIEEGFVRSLAHCVPWAAKGGKSGSTFCKTKDDRYVLKEMTKPEWQQFLEFAPHYFNYVTSCRQSKLPSLLARILGVYSVGGAGNGVLVMENIWYGCARDVKRFDLKGSSRHRLTADTHPLAVLMDENLLNLRWESPLYVQSHTGSALWACIERDTTFLAKNSVMDYSLLLGVNSHTLVLGLIDYIRTFTWDKKLEHLVKKNLGSGQPTVVSPEQYKRRFTIACKKYFLQCPSHWDHLYDTIHA